MSDFPTFKYHPDPVGTGSVVRSTMACACCGEARGYIYTGPFYSRTVLNRFCPWCIADGRAATEFGGEFHDVTGLFPLVPGRDLETWLPAAVIDEVLCRTPGFTLYNPVAWVRHCGDACAYHGVATTADLRRSRLADEDGSEDEGLFEEVRHDGYDPATADFAYLNFHCLHCRARFVTLDRS